MNNPDIRWMVVLLTAALIVSSACHRAPAPGDLAAGLRASGLEDWDEAATRWEKAAALDPGDAAAHNNLAVAYETKGFRDKARAEYEAALALAPTNPCIRANFASFAAGSGEIPAEAVPADEVSAGRVAGRCRSVTVNVAGRVPTGLEEVEEVVIADFEDTEAREDVRLGPELAEYLAAEIRRSGRLRAARASPEPAGAVVSTESELAKSAAAGRPRAIVLAGDVSLSEETQKGLRTDGLPKEGPFRPRDKGLEERKVFTLRLRARLYGPDGAGLLVQKDFEHFRTYPGPDYAPTSALVELFEGLKNKLLPELLGEAKSETRHLLLRPAR